MPSRCGISFSLSSAEDWKPNQRTKSLRIFKQTLSQAMYSQYRPLSQEKLEIRVVELLPLRDPNEAISLNLFHVSLIDLPSYRALSYTWGMPFHGLPAEWGDPKANILALLNGDEFPLQYNLEAAIRHLCLNINQSIVLWIDAICINQLDANERNNQVGLMGKIYAQAEEVIVWLGPPSEDSELAVQSFMEWSASWSKRAPELTPKIFDKAHAIEYPRLRKDELGMPSIEARLEAVANFFLRYWWRRAWIVQEVVLGHGNLTFYLGSSTTCTWDCVVSAVSLLLQHLSAPPALDLVLDNKDSALQEMLRATLLSAWTFERIRTIIKETQSRRDNELPRFTLFPESGLPRTFYGMNVLGKVELSESPFADLPHTLHLLSSSKATEPRDRVFAALGITNNAELVTIDYEKPVAEVYKDVSRKWIEKEQDLQVLDYCSPSPREGLPSWAVDWERPLHRIPLPKRREVNLKEKIYSASGTLPLKYAFEGDNTLVLTGFTRDVVSFVHKKESDEHDDLLAALRAENLDDLLKQGRLTSKNQIQQWEFYNNFLRCWVDYLKENGTPPTLQIVTLVKDKRTFLIYKPTQESIWDALIRVRIADVLIDDDRNYIGRTQNSSQWEKPGAKELFQLRMCHAILPGRTLFASSSGFIGLGPKEVKDGDRICSIFGNETLFLLRPKGENEWTFVGECYVHGLMDSQIYDIEPREGRTFKECIRKYHVV